MNKQATFLIIAGIIVVVAVVIAGIFWHAGMVQAPTSTRSTTITYTNNTYGFTFSLPADWRGYTIVTSTWQGNENETVTGLEISIRNPNWTQANPTQDIPIMIFTPAEWNFVSSGTLAVSAAPIPPSELGANTSYVFALPARYNYAYPNGWQEVASIMQSNPLHAFDLSSTPGYFNGKQICKTNADCPANDYCTVAGPLLANQPTPATCWPQGEAVPL